MNFLPTRKIMALMGCRSNYAKRDRRSSLHECLEQPARSWGRWWLLLLLISAIYLASVFHSGASTSSLYTPVEVAGSKIVRFENNKKTFKYDVVMNSTTDKRAIITDSTTIQPSSLPVCVLNHTQLGKISINTRDSILLYKQYPIVKNGGHYKPFDCEARHQVGILVPYRDRQTNLAVFLYNIHPFLINQKLEYRIFVVEQFGKDLFNKGRLYNAGYKEMFQFGNWKCIVFHDVDLLPLDARILYTCPICPRHMCATVREKKHSRNYHALFGGVTSMTPAHYKKANGYSNLYWGWGGEDNDMFWRLRAARLNVVRYNKSIAEYTALPHSVRHKNRFRFELLHTAMERAQDEGLSTVEYKVVAVTMHHLYTHLLIDVNPYKDNITLFVRNYY